MAFFGQNYGFTKSTSTKKLTFFDQKHGLTLLKNLIFRTLKPLFFIVKKGSFFSAKSLRIISSLFFINCK